MNRIFWTAPALLNLQVIRDYLAQFNPYAAKKVAAEILETAEQLSMFPQRGRLVPGSVLREVMTSYPYIIRYRMAEETVIILRIRHMARQAS